VDLSRPPTNADADRLSALATRAETARDCAALPDLRRGDVVELRCVSSLGRSPWLETTVEDVVAMDWGEGHVIPDVEPAVAAVLEAWLHAASREDAEQTGRASPPLPLSAMAPPPARGGPAAAAGAARSAMRAAAAPPSAVERGGWESARHGVADASEGTDTSRRGRGPRTTLSGSTLRAAVAQAAARHRAVGHAALAAAPFGRAGFRVSHAVVDEDNRLVARHRLRLLRRAPVDHDEVEARQPGRWAGCWALRAERAEADDRGRPRGTCAVM